MIRGVLVRSVTALHALVVRVYPATFRHRFGKAMTLAVQDAISATARSRGLAAALSEGVRALLDTLAGVAPARAQAVRDRALWPAPQRHSRRSVTLMTDSLLLDGRVALRTIGRAPLFAASTVLVLALGLGATGAIYAVVRGVLWQPLPYHDPHGLVMIWSDHTREQRPRNPISPADFLDYRAKTQTFERIEGLYSFLLPQRIEAPDGIEVAQGSVVTSGLFELLGRRALIGRTFAADETRGVVVLSYGYWQRRFGGDRGAIGQRLPLVDQVEARPTGAATRGVTIIGVMPPDFVFPYRSMLGPMGFSRASDVDLWLPMAFEGARFADAGGPVRPVRFLAAIGRLKPGMSIEAAREDLAAVATQLAASWPASNAGWGATAVPLLDQTVGTVRPALLLLFGAVTCLLAMTCVNVANLFLARSVGRARDLAVRTALGAGRRRLVQQTLVESLVLAIAGGIAALAVARVGLTALIALAPPDLPRLHGVALDAGVWLFMLTAAAIAGLAIGAVSCAAVIGIRLPLALRSAGRGAVGASGRRGLRATLVVAQVGLAVVLTVGATLLTRSFVTVLDVDPGFRPDSLLTLQMNVPDTYDTPPKRLAYYRTLFERLGALPGVRAVGGTTRLPLGSTSVTTAIAVEGRDVPEHARPEAEMRRALHHYFEAMAIPVLAGRAFTSEDGPTAAPVAVINRALADRLFGRDAAVGRRVRMGPGQTGTWLTIVGVVGNIRHLGLEQAPAPEIYIHYLQGPPVAPFLVLRVDGDPAAQASAVRAAIRGVNRSTPVIDVRTMQQVRSASVSQRRFILLLTGLFGTLALLLAGVGVYGVMALIVAERTQEVGVRLALGARPVDMLGLILGQTGRLALAGIAAGLGVAALLAPALASQLYGVDALDLPTYAVVAAVLLGVATLAALAPARVAMRVDPIVALRGD